MELFDKQFVYFMWENELEGKEGFFADNIHNLSIFVNDGVVRKICKKSENEEYPFTSPTNSSRFRFFYYDPNYEYKVAYAEGKQIQVFEDGKWLDCCKPIWSNNFVYRVKLEEFQSRHMTYRELAEWLAKGNGQFTPLEGKAFVSSSLDYDDKIDNIKLPKGYKIRRWGSNEWVEPTLDIYKADCKKVIK